MIVVLTILVQLTEDVGQTGPDDVPLLAEPHAPHHQPPVGVSEGELESLQVSPPDPPHHHGPGTVSHHLVELLKLPDHLHHVPLHGDLHLEAEGPRLLLGVEIGGEGADGETGLVPHLSGVELLS